MANTSTKSRSTRSAGTKQAGKQGGKLDQQQALVRELLKRHGRTYADEAGITLRDTPQPLYQLLVLSLLLSARIRSDIAVGGGGGGGGGRGGPPPPRGPTTTPPAGGPPGAGPGV
ncbi:hypothetical protein ACFW4X_23735, partial [Streptomyces smyrnaeus]